jgi:hypothetical protein
MVVDGEELEDEWVAMTDGWIVWGAEERVAA